MRTRKIFPIIIVVALTAGFGYRVYRLASEAKKATRRSASAAVVVKATPVEKGTVRRDISLTGDVQASTAVQVFPKCPGRLIELAVTKEGDTDVPIEEGLFVKKDQVIAVIDHEGLDALVDQAKAALATAKARLKQAEVTLTQTQKDLQRIRNLYKEGATSKQSLDKIEADYEGLVAQRDVAKASVDQSQAALNNAQIQLSECYIGAPISGIVSHKYLDQGDMAMVTRPIVAIIDVDKVKVTADLPERYLGQIREGADASLEVDAFPGRVFRGIVTRISPTLNIVNRTAELEITVDNPDHDLKPGMFARVILNIVKREGVPVIPEAAVMRDQSGEYVFVVEKGFARRRKVKLGLQEGPKIEIVEGLQPGEMLVIAGQQKTSDGQPVQIWK